MPVWINGPFGEERPRPRTSCIAVVADRIADTIGLTVAPNTDSLLHGRPRRMAVTVRNTRL
ncbi:hypothetical protein OG203_16570 [Nocardia sp. NBC_01499]|uniref:hypothetical protein n=1 Tax=Nocardia sp. NBC_01499 TaxID=2903597 RepID=UPI00386E25A6